MVKKEIEGMSVRHQCELFDLYAERRNGRESAYYAIFGRTVSEDAVLWRAPFAPHPSTDR